MYHSKRDIATMQLYNKNWEDIDFASDERPSKSILQKYCERPERLASFTLLMFAIFFGKRSSISSKKEICSFQNFPLISLNHDSTFTEKYYRQQILLNFPGVVSLTLYCN